jgi:3-deoxy-D-manno-octulosonic-acid transferase
MRTLGCRAERVVVSGNLKFDVRVPQEAEATRILKALAPSSRFLIAGSTLEGEETALLETRTHLLGANPKLIFVLAPRHPERFEAVARLLESYSVPWVRRSAWRGKTAGDLDALGGGEVVLLDSIGELASVYSIATVAFVGGSLVPAGGHNPLEPAQFGVPIVMGPHYANFRAMTDDLLAHDALRIARKEELSEVLVKVVSSPAEAQAMGERARRVFEEQAGATARSIEAIRDLLHVETETSAGVEAR